MVKTNRTNPHSEDPIRRSNQTAGKSPASEQPAACKPAAARKATSLVRKDTAACKDTAAHGGSDKFSGERKGPPEAIVPAPEAIVPRLPTLLAGIDFAAAGHDFAAPQSLALQGATPGPITANTTK